MATGQWGCVPHLNSYVWVKIKAFRSFIQGEVRLEKNYNLVVVRGGRAHYRCLEWS